MPIIEDDAYGFVATNAPPPISSLVPNLAWHILGVSKAFGAGLRLAFTTAPDRERLSAFVQTIRTINVMTSPLNLALLSTWIEEGTADEMLVDLRRSVRRRQAIARSVLEGFEYEAQDESLQHLAQSPRRNEPRGDLARTASGSLAIMPSDVFTFRATRGKASCLPWRPIVRERAGGRASFATIRPSPERLDRLIITTPQGRMESPLHMSWVSQADIGDGIPQLASTGCLSLEQIE